MNETVKNTHSKWEQVRIGGVEVDGISLTLLMQRLDEMVESGGPHYVCFCDAHLCGRATQEPKICNILGKASLILPDGVSLTLGPRLMGYELPGRLPELILPQPLRQSLAVDYRSFVTHALRLQRVEFSSWEPIILTESF